MEITELELWSERNVADVLRDGGESTNIGNETDEHIHM